VISSSSARRETFSRRRTPCWVRSVHGSDVEGTSETLTGQRMTDLAPLAGGSPRCCTITFFSDRQVGSVRQFRVVRVAGRKILPVLQADSTAISRPRLIGAHQCRSAIGD
jgi:hypothetical protein